MTNLEQHRARPPKDASAGGTVALAVVLVLAVVAAQPALAQTYTVLYSFTGNSDGQGPTAGLVWDTAGTLYGTTVEGGGGGHSQNGYGTVFKVKENGIETVLYRFNGTNHGGNPSAGLIRDAESNLYGTTSSGGRGGLGTAFKLSKGGKETVLHSFTGYPSDGALPAAGLVQDSAGNFYGTTSQGGSGSGSACDSYPYGCGTVFKLDTSGTESVLYSFAGGTDGGDPQAGVILDAAGNLYGTTANGGDLSCNNGFGCGTVFKVDTSGTESVLYSFTGKPDGAYPYAGLTLDAAGNLYGTTIYGGISGYACDAQGCGVVFKVDTTGTETVLYSFKGGPDGAGPEAVLIQDAQGNFYGTTSGGGSRCCDSGAVFKLDTTGKETVLHRFGTGSDGHGPSGGLIRDAKGDLYGTTGSGGDMNCGGGYGCGVVFKLRP